MRVVLKDRSNETYYKSPEVWTKDIFEAMDFGTNDRAIQVADQLNGRDLELLNVNREGKPMFGLRLK